MEVANMVSIPRLMKELPENYEQLCFETNAIQRKRGISDPANLMMLAFFHLLNGCSLMEISAIAKLTKLGEMSDVAFMKRFEHCNAWFEKILEGITPCSQADYEPQSWLKDYNVIATDASDVCEKGRSGRVFRLHYALDLFRMKTHQYAITSNKVGETLCNFTAQENDLFLADRAYGSLRGVKHCLESKANFILRLRTNCFAFYDSEGKKIDLLQAVVSRCVGDYMDLSATANGDGENKIPLRVCAVRKPADAVERTRKQLASKSKKKQIAVTDEAKLFNEYIVLVTALPRNITAEQVLQAYRLRWQVEMYFKRLKSILDLGEMPKRREGSVFAWLNGKLIIALLLEKIIGSNVFSPEGLKDAEYLA